MVATCRRCSRAFAALVAALLLSQAIARADYTSTDNKLPSPVYVGTNGVDYNTTGGQYHIDSFFDIFTEISITGGKVNPAPGTTKTDSFFDVFTELDLTPPGGSPGSASTGASGQLRISALPAGTPQLYGTEMLQMQLNGLPGGIMIRESPTVQSLGQASITDLGGGLFHIDSFFDVFTELSIDGGVSWVAGNTQLHITGLPEPGSMMLCGIGAAIFAARRRPRAA